MVLLFDAANTLIYKPQLFVNSSSVFERYGYSIPLNLMKRNHKLVSEIISFPDQTNKDFYIKFNTEWLLSLGIIPNEEILRELFQACSYLAWEKFEDAKILTEIKIEKAILSNFKGSLTNIIDENFPSIFKEIIISENEHYRKPDIRFFKTAIEKLQVDAKDILYIGDSLKLDITPAKNVGMRALLIDRENDYPYFKNRIQSLNELFNYI